MSASPAIDRGRQLVRDALAAAIGDPALGGRLALVATSEVIAPETEIQACDEVVADVIVVECGVFEVARAGEPPRWATAGSVIGLAAALSATCSPSRVTALRHGRVARLPAAALGEALADSHSVVADVARVAQLHDHALATLPPDPLVIAVLLEDCDSATEAALTSQLESATQALDGARFVALPLASAGSTDDRATVLAAYEQDASTVIYLVHASAGEHAAAIVAHADRVLVLQPSGSDSDSDAYKLACDGSARRCTDLVYVGGLQTATNRTTTQLRRPPQVRRMHIMPEPTAAELGLLLTELRDAARSFAWLRDVGVFRDLDDAELAWINAELRWERVDGGTILLGQGDDADAAWLVRAGRLEVVRRTSVSERHIAWVGPGVLIADAALLTGGPRSSSVRAVRDSTVARLDKNVVDTLLARSATFARALARMFAAGVRPAPASNGRATTFAVVPLASAGRTRALVGELANACASAGLDATVVDAARLDAALGEGASRTRRGDVRDSGIIAWLDALERRHDVVVLTCEATVDSWTRRAVRQGDHILLVADAMSSPELRPIEHELLGVAAVDVTGLHRAQGTETDGLSRTRHLVLLQPAGITEASGTSAWLEPRPEYVHHHMRAGNDSDLARLARRVTGRAVVLALSGASSRAPAHFGVVRAMDAQGLPIDVVSGSSSGAGIAALIATGMRGNLGLDRAMQIIATGAPTLSQFQPPLTALTSGKVADRSLQAVFGDRLLEDQMIPAVLTAVDIRRHRAVHLTRGPVWKLVRASGALPLLWPPVWHEGDLLVDGGIIDYLPTDVFGAEADDGLVIASNLDETAGIGAPAFEGTLDYGTVANGWAELVRRLRGARAPRPPAITDILFHSMGIPSFQQQEGLAALKERDNVCVITPTLGSFGLFEVSDAVGRRLESTTFEHARAALAGAAARWHGRGTASC